MESVSLTLVVGSSCTHEISLVNLSPFMVKGFSDMSPAEIEQVQRWTNTGMTPNAIAELQCRDPGTVNKYIVHAIGNQKVAKKIALASEFRARLVKINRSRSFARTRVEVKKTHLKKKQEQKEDIHALHRRRGRPPMTAADYKNFEQALKRLQIRAKGEEEVTAAMVLEGPCEIEAYNPI